MIINVGSVNDQPGDANFVTWFVDEVGDPTLFGKGGKVVAATKVAPDFSLLENWSAATWMR